MVVALSLLYSAGIEEQYLKALPDQAGWHRVELRWLHGFFSAFLPTLAFVPISPMAMRVLAAPASRIATLVVVDSTYAFGTWSAPVYKLTLREAGTEAELEYLWCRNPTLEKLTKGEAVRAVIKSREGQPAWVAEVTPVQ